MPVCSSCGQDNPDIARFCLACAAPLISKPSPQRRKLATLLFCDMSGSTAMGERVDSEAVREMMFEYFARMRAIIESHGGTVEKYVGDAVMAAFGVPAAHEDDALRAVKAAFAMQQRMKTFNNELEQRFGSRIALRIGINTGEVVAGDARSRETFVTGDAVNVAARLEQAAEPGEVLIGGSTWRLVAGDVEVEPTEPLSLKGKSEPLPAYRLLNVLESSSARSSRSEVAMVGRADEFAHLLEAFSETVRHRRCRLVNVVGEPGIGKSRLISQFIDELSNEATVLSGRCLSYGDGTTFWPIAEMVHQAAGITSHDSPELARSRILSVVERADDSETIAERIALAIGLVEGTAVADEIAWAVRRFLESLAQQAPLVVVFDDIHWAEPVLLDVIASLARLSRVAPLLVVCLAREEVFPTDSDLGTTRRLAPLGVEDTNQLIEQVLGQAEVSPRVRSRITWAADGNPLFVQELLAMLIEDGQLRQEGGKWVSTNDLQDIVVPPTIDLLLAARLDRLEDELRAAIERGSIEGQVFHGAAVGELAPEIRPELARIFQNLIAREFLQPADGIFSREGAYGFRHILMREAAYHSTAKRLRAELHSRLADWLEEKAGTRVPEYEEIIGFHLEQAFRYLQELGPVDEKGQELSVRSARMLIRAGRRSFARGDAPAAVALLERGSSLLPEDSLDRARALLELGAAFREMGGHFERCKQVLEEALELAKGWGEKILSLHILLEDSLARLNVSEKGSADRLRAIAEQALTDFENVQDDAGLARAWSGLGFLHLFTMQLEPCRVAFERAVEYADRSGDERLVNHILPWLGAPLAHGPIPVERAMIRCRKMLGSEEQGPNVRGAFLVTMAKLVAMTGDFEAARRYLADARAIGEELGSLLTLNAVSEHGYAVEKLAGDPVAAERACREGYDMLCRTGDLAALSTRATELAEALYDQSRYEEAEAMIDQGLGWAAPEDAATQTMCRVTKARLLARKADFGTAERLGREAVNQIEQTDALKLHGDALLGLAEVLRLSARDREAIPLVEKAITLYVERGDVVSEANARRLLEPQQTA